MKRNDRRMWFAAMWLSLALAGPLVAQSPQSLSRRDPEELRRRGVGPILREPKFVPAARATFLKSEDQVLALSANGVAKAYLATAVAFHHVIDDRLGDMPIMATW